MGWHAPPTELTLNNPLWQMAIELWSHPKFEQSCLEAQDQGIPVSHILVALFSARNNYDWSGREPESIRGWRNEVTENLRAIRQHLPRRRDDTAALRNNIKQGELEAERLELAWWWHQFGHTSDWLQVQHKTCAELARSNLVNAGMSETQALRLAPWLEAENPARAHEP